MSKLTEKQEELREAMRRLKFPTHARSDVDPTGRGYGKACTQLGMSPSEMKNKHAFTSNPYDTLAHINWGEEWHPGKAD